MALSFRNTAVEEVSNSRVLTSSHADTIATANVFELNYSPIPYPLDRRLACLQYVALFNLVGSP